MNLVAQNNPAGGGCGQSPLLIYLLALAGGAGRNAVIYANVLARAGHSVCLVCGTTKGERLEEKLDPRVALHHLGTRRNLRALPGLTRTLRRVQPERALVIGPSNMAPFAIAAKAAGFHGEVILRVADSPTGMQTVYPPITRLAKRWSFTRYLRRASQVIALTQDMAHELEHHWGIAHTRIHYIPNGVPLPASPVVRAEDDPPVLLCVARLAPQKDHESLLRAFAIVRGSRNCRLVLAGEGRERHRLETLAQNLGIANDTMFLGQVADVTPLYRRARLMVLSSRHEGFPNVLIEALAHGCPVVATDCPTGPAEVIDSPEVGLLAEVGNPESLAARIIEALDRSFDTVLLRARAEVFSEDRLHARIRALFGPVDRDR